MALKVSGELLLHFDWLFHVPTRVNRLILNTQNLPINLLDPPLPGLLLLILLDHFVKPSFALLFLLLQRKRLFRRFPNLAEIRTKIGLYQRLVPLTFRAQGLLRLLDPLRKPEVVISFLQLNLLRVLEVTGAVALVGTDL